MNRLQVAQQAQQQWQANALLYYESCCHEYEQHEQQQAQLQSQTPPASAPAAPAIPTGAATATPIAAAAARHVAADSEDDSDVADKVLVGGAGTALANEKYTYASGCGKVGKYAREAELADASGHSRVLSASRSTAATTITYRQRRVLSTFAAGTSRSCRPTSSRARARRVERRSFRSGSFRFGCPFCFV